MRIQPTSLETGLLIIFCALCRVKDLDSAHSTRVAQSDQKLEGLEKALRDMNQHLDAERSQTTQQLGSFIDMQRKDVADITSRLEETFQKQITNLSDVRVPCLLSLGAHMLVQCHAMNT